MKWLATWQVALVATTSRRPKLLPRKKVSIGDEAPEAEMRVDGVERIDPVVLEALRRMT